VDIEQKPEEEVTSQPNQELKKVVIEEHPPQALEKPSQKIPADALYSFLRLHYFRKYKRYVKCLNKVMAVQRLQTRVVEGIQHRRKIRQAFEKMKVHYLKAQFNKQMQDKFQFYLKYSRRLVQVLDRVILPLSHQRLSQREAFLAWRQKTLELKQISQKAKQVASEQQDFVTS
jgi:DNA topoisomerase IA